MSDIHGCQRTFLKALRTVDFKKGDDLFLLGDYIDRGLDSCGVIKSIMELQQVGHNIVALKGNHEDFLLQSYVEDDIKVETYSGYRDSVFASWMMNGGVKCLASYGYVDSGYVNVNWRSVIPKHHLEWMQSLPLMAVTDEFVFCHAGLDFSTSDPINNTSEDCLLWSRTGYVDSSKIGGRLLVTGHTPRSKQQMEDMVSGKDAHRKHIIVDRGCVFTQSDYGHLAVLNLDTKYINFVKNIDVIQSDMVGGW
jgi:serine/threonine protein phosphatase 1